MAKLQTSSKIGKIETLNLVNIEDSNLNMRWYSLNNGQNIIFTENGSISESAGNALSDGTVTITFYANDSAGNSASESVTVEKDTTTPNVHINSPNSDQVFGEDAPTYNVEITDSNLEIIHFIRVILYA